MILYSEIFRDFHIFFTYSHRFYRIWYFRSGQRLAWYLIDGHPQLELQTAETGACKISNLLTAESRKKSKNSCLQTKIARTCSRVIASKPNKPRKLKFFTCSKFGPNFEMMTKQLNSRKTRKSELLPKNFFI